MPCYLLSVNINKCPGYLCNEPYGKTSSDDSPGLMIDYVKLLNIAVLVLKLVITLKGK